MIKCCGLDILFLKYANSQILWVRCGGDGSYVKGASTRSHQAEEGSYSQTKKPGMEHEQKKKSIKVILHLMAKFLNEPIDLPSFLMHTMVKPLVRFVRS